MQSLKEKTEESILYNQSVLNAIDKFPDLHEVSNRWGHKKLVSKHVNELVNDVSIHHSCGCCDDAVLQAEPFLEFGNLKIYSEPNVFSIGTKQGLGDVEWEYWEKDFVKHGICDKIFDKVRCHFKDNPPDFGEDDEEENYNPCC